ncbi:DDT domain-containing protein [Emydomyces testavorans]|uniref:DDT domain-containing protein n=1 Tax=Emydomyces testavorans TaxID=2070801 RepID=A0AAF0DMK2_9EURO|nr:DDT domain-containing protein [Emydomyces testavorans]
MVLFKRKPVQYLPRPTIEDDSSEAEGSKEVDNSFPEALKDPVLRKVQFSTVSRIDSLVDQVYEDFKQDFYPGERVTVLLTNGSRLQGMVREKARFPEIRRTDGILERRASSRYLVKLINRHNEEALVDDEHLARDRKIFTKQMLRSFIKNTVSRESWNGAPWLVKPHIADFYNIDTEVPQHLQYGNKAGKKAKVAADKQEDEKLFGFFSSQRPRLKPTVKPQKVKTPQELARAREEQYEAYRRSLNGNPSFRLPKNGQHKVPLPPSEVPLNLVPEFSIVINNGVPPLPPPPPIKYPIEDLDISPAGDGSRRPSLRFLTNDDVAEKLDLGLKMESVGALLETWNTLNVYCEVFQLDSFTFDDFVEAMRFSSDEINCELFVEIHCAVLKILVNSEKDQEGAIQVPLPAVPDEDLEEESEESESVLEQEPEPTRRSTRSTLVKVEIDNAKASPRSRSYTADAKVHRAAEMFGEYGWIDRLRKRDFKNGGWELVMIGLIHRLSSRPRLQKTCDQILMHLAPLDAEPTQETALKQYSTLDVNLRVHALQVICMLALETRAIKNYLEECSNQMTEFRKEKIELQRARKATLEELRKLHEERKDLEPERAPSPIPEPEEAAETKALATAEESEVPDESDEEEIHIGRSLRGGADRELERKRRQEEERLRKELAVKLPKVSKQYQRVLKKIEDLKAKVQSYETDIAVLDNDLREADCPRTRVLGKDRFWNRYYWFERNGMPYEGLPSSSTASAGYANGRLWVQGPDEMEREGFIDLPDELNKPYVKRFGLTVAERKRAEEGPTGVINAQEWGYYDDPDDLDKLIKWLDNRGVREAKLRKELQLHRDKIAKYMNNRKEYLSQHAARAESEEEPPARMATRTKKVVEHSSHRCLKWTNLTALRDNGHLHVDPERPTKRARKSTESSKEARSTNRQGKPLTRQGTRYTF